VVRHARRADTARRRTLRGRLIHDGANKRAEDELVLPRHSQRYPLIPEGELAPASVLKDEARNYAPWFETLDFT
jgi:hypothetical protein